MSVVHLIAQIAPDLGGELGARGPDLLQQGAAASTAIAQGWNQIWNTVFQSALYTALCQIGILFTIGSLIFFMINAGREMIVDGEFSNLLISLVRPLLVLLLIFNNGFMLSHGTMAVRGFMHTINQRVLSITLNEVTLQQAIQRTTDNAALNSAIQALLSQCVGLTGQDQVNCLQASREQAQQLMQRYGVTPEQIGLPNPQNQGGENGGLLGLQLYSVGNIFAHTLQDLLLGFQWAFVNLLEVSMLLTGLIGPLALSGILLAGSKPFFAWLAGFLSLGMAQLFYNIILGIVAEVMVAPVAQQFNTMGFLVFLCILAPILAVALASGGGMAVFGSMVATGSAVMVMGINKLKL